MFFVVVFFKNILTYVVSLNYITINRDIFSSIGSSFVKNYEKRRYFGNVHKNYMSH